jgi:dipicolinate synthase subunit B
MTLENWTIGFALTGSFCTMQAALDEMQKLVEAGAKIIPIISDCVRDTDTRFYSKEDLRFKIARITGAPIIQTIGQAEPIGPQKLLDALVIAPCTGNTLAKLAASVSDTPVLMASKAHLRNGRPIVIAISTNDGLAGNAKNIGVLLNMRNHYFVPFGQDDPKNKCRSLVARMHLIRPTLEEALEGRQIQPIMVGPEEH